MKMEQAPNPASGEEEILRYGTREDRALILHTQRLSTEDGPGIRTTVFFKGCPLHCNWCHNPESLSARPQMQWLESRCIGCGICIKSCPNGCLAKNKDGIARDRTRCYACSTCADACPAGAQEILGRQRDLEELLSELLKDKVYYDTSGGGVTLSGGEPLMQPEFVVNLLARLKEKGIATAVDTCGMCSATTLEAVLPYTDLILFDLKEIDPDRHRAFTGRDNGRILDNARFLGNDPAVNQGEKILWIRTPLIPGATANRETIERVGDFIEGNLKGAVQRWELCAFNNLCRDKYRRLGLEWKYAAAPLLCTQELEELERVAKGSGPDPDTIFTTGAAGIE